MAKKKSTNSDNDDDDYFDGIENDLFDEYEELDFRKTSHKYSSHARRRHEQLKEEKMLERLLNSEFDFDYDDFSNFNHYGDFDDLYERN